MTVSEKAYAKINLYLDVTGRREDGFHDILSVMHSVSLCDVITVSAERSDDTLVSITSNNQSLPLNEDNIVYRAAKEYLDYFNLKARVEIRIDKNIPIGAGLGGGSSDAAATLRAINKIFKCGYGIDLINICKKLGSDVSFCLFGGLYLCSGRGEELYKLESSIMSNYVVAIGDCRVSTPKAYAELDKKYNNFVNYNPKDVSLVYHNMIVDLETNGETAIPLYNIFENVIANVEVNKIKENMIKSGADYVLMSGSGPSVFGKFLDYNMAQKACQILSDAGFTAFVCHSVYPEVNI